jgi:hypothetical protein
LQAKSKYFLPQNVELAKTSGVMVDLAMRSWQSMESQGGLKKAPSKMARFRPGHKQGSIALFRK